MKTQIFTSIKNNLGMRIFGFSCLFAIIGYLIAGLLIFGRGFPLDDAWIHQTYARNLVELGEWSFIPGHVSAGSTAPLWSLVLSLGYLVNIDYYIFISMVASVSLFYIGFLVCKFIDLQLANKSNLLWLISSVFIFDWRIVWAALSGMETLMYTLSILLVMYLLFRLDLNKAWHLLLIGAISGLTVWLRPEGITILGPIAWVLAFSEGYWREKIIRFRFVLIGLLILLVPYAMLNLNLSGEILPNTFAAKQMEYAVLLEQPLLTRLLSLGLQPLIGVGVALVPGVIYEVYYSIKQKQYKGLSILLWGLGIIIIYAVRLPVTYQHGRYIMPAISILIFYGLLGFVRWWGNTEGVRKFWAINRAWLAIIVLLTVGFWWLGAQSYAKDVAIIETEMVDIAYWSAENLPDDALIAAHDIGALGYLGEHEILDLAGLISPEVIPFMRDEKKLAEYLDEQGADYLITFEGWYPELEKQGELIYSTESEYSLAEGSTNMVVYKWRLAEE